jgi:hypothetical protein
LGTIGGTLKVLGRIGVEVLGRIIGVEVLGRIGVEVLGRIGEEFG